MKRFRRPLTFAALGLIALVAIGLIVRAVANWCANVRLEEKIAALRAAGEPLTLADLARKPIPPESNAAVVLRRAKSDIEAIQKEVEAAYDAASEADQRAYDEGRPSEAMQRAIRVAFEAYPNAIGLLEQAAECPDYDPQLDFTLDTHSFIDAIVANCHNSRPEIRALRYRFSLLLADGKHDEALSTCLVMFRLCRHFDRDPMFVSYLVALALRGGAIDATDIVLRSGALPESAYDALDAELARHKLVEPYQQALRAERAFGLQYFRELVSDTATLSPSHFTNDQCDYLEFIDQLIENAPLPYSDSQAQTSAERLMARVGPQTQLIVPAAQTFTDARCRLQAEICCLRVLIALLRSEHSTDLGAPKITDLGLPLDAITDPYNGKLLHLKKLPDGWLIYSVGRDLIDGGGANLGGTDGEDAGLGPARLRREAADRDKTPK